MQNVSSFSKRTHTLFSGQLLGVQGETVQYPPREARSQNRPGPHSALVVQLSPTSVPHAESVGAVSAKTMSTGTRGCMARGLVPDTAQGPQSPSATD
jgi:hypothetical protein